MEIYTEGSIWLLEFIRIFADYASMLPSGYGFDVIKVKDVKENYSSRLKPLVLDVDEKYLYSNVPRELISPDNIEIIHLPLNVFAQNTVLRVILKKVYVDNYKIVCYLLGKNISALDTSYYPTCIVLLESNGLDVTSDEMAYLKAILPKHTQQFSKQETGFIAYKDRLLTCMDDIYRYKRSIHENYKKPVQVYEEGERRRFIEAFFNKAIENPRDVLKLDPNIIAHIGYASQVYMPTSRKKGAHIEDSISTMYNLYWASGILTTLSNALQSAYVELLEEADEEKLSNPIMSKALSAHVFIADKSMRDLSITSISDGLKGVISHIAFVLNHISISSIPEKIALLKDFDVDPGVFRTNVMNGYFLAHTSYETTLENIMYLFFSKMDMHHYELAEEFIKDMVSALIDAYNDPQTPRFMKENIKATLHIIYYSETENFNTKQAFTSIMALLSAYELYYMQKNVDKKMLLSYFTEIYEKIAAYFYAINENSSMKDSVRDYFDNPKYQYLQYDKVFKYSQNKRLKPKMLLSSKPLIPGIVLTTDVYKEVRQMIQKIISTS